MTPLEQKFRGGGEGGSNRKNHPWEGYGYFLESHNANTSIAQERQEHERWMKTLEKTLMDFFSL